MDIRKFLKKPTKKPESKSGLGLANRPSASNAASPKPTRSSPRRKKAVVKLDHDDDQDDDDEEEVKPVRRKRVSKSASAADKKDAPPAPKPAPKKRGRPSTKKPPTDMSGGFGGSAVPDAAAEEPPAKKKKWIPRSDDPPNRGNKPLPIGARNCLAGKVFVITGVLDSLLRDECADLCKEYGARVVSAVSKKVTHGIVGMEPGESKLSKLKANRAPTIDEDELFRMINSTRPAKDEEDEVETMDITEPKKEEVQEMDVDEKPLVSSSVVKAGDAPRAGHGSASLWVDKYKPSQSDQLVANPKAIKDLKMWLSNWKGKFLRGAGHSLKQKDRGDSDYAAALLVGPPGIGKTSAAHIVCRELGFEPHEFNASDIRNKGGVQLLAETVMVANTMSRYLKIKTKAEINESNGGKSRKDSSIGPRSYREGQVLIMDEVDGMSGGDRGGSQELLKMIKTSKVPIICIANDDSSSNMRSLASNCYKLRFRRPTAVQVTKRLMDIVRREGFREVDGQTIRKLAEGCNGDIRQMINMLQAWRSTSAKLSFGEVKARLENEGKTVVQRSIFELAKGFFSPGPSGSQNSFETRMDNYFADSDLVPLFVMENYVSTGAASHSLEALADAAECICEGDLCNSLIRKQQRWELMPAASVLSAIRPGSILAGGLNSQPMFPSFLGNMSKGNKWKRVLQGLEMKAKVGKTSCGSATAFRLDYIPALTTCLATPMIRDGAAGYDEVINRLDAYFMERDPDWIEILEAGVYAKGRSPMENIPGAVRNGFTKAYNAKSHVRSTVTGLRVGVKQDVGGFERAKGGEDVAVVDEDPVEEGGNEEEDEDEKVRKEFGVSKRGRRPGSRGGGRKKESRGRGRAKKS